MSCTVCYYFVPSRWAKYCERCVCLSVHLHIIARVTNFHRDFLYMSPVVIEDTRVLCLHNKYVPNQT